MEQTFLQGQMLAVRSPWDRSQIDVVEATDLNHAEAALDRLVKSFQTGVLSRAVERIEILKATAAGLKARRDEFADLIAWEGGKPLIDSRVEVDRAIKSFEIAADEAGRAHGVEVPMRATAQALGHLAWTVPEPIGVVFAISAFNHPLNLLAHQIGPAIAAGCPILIKPALETPLTCLRLLEVLAASGLPKDFCLPLICDNNVAEALVRSKKISFFSFIGSAKVGWYLRSILAPGVRCSLEHGGSAPAIVDRSCDLKTAIAMLVRGGYYHAGQVCVSTQRIFVHREIFAEVEAQLVKAVGLLKVGDPRREETQVGPLIRERDLLRVEKMVKEAVHEGGRVLCGGQRFGATAFAPTVLSDVGASMSVMRDEVFGPVTCLAPFADLDQAIVMANDVEWQFQASVFTSEIDAALRAARRLRASAVMINESTAFRVDWMPFRGDGPSGLGTGGIPFSVRDLTREKMLLLKTDAWT